MSTLTPKADIYEADEKSLLLTQSCLQQQLEMAETMEKESKPPKT